MLRRPASSDAATCRLAMLIGAPPRTPARRSGSQNGRDDAERASGYRIQSGAGATLMVEARTSARDQATGGPDRAVGS